VKTFAHWRVVGAAMRWARQQEGVERCVFTEDGIVEQTWMRDEQADEVTLGGLGTLAHSLTIDLADGRHLEAVHLPAVDILRVLAALDLIPARLAYAADERYGKCQRCGRLAQWWPAEAEAGERWTHVTRLRFDLNPHPAEVTS
jgi:hypothetical protein